MCEHLKELEDYLHEAGVEETYRGQPWTENCREWIYFACVLDAQSLKDKFAMEEFVSVHDFYEPKAGSEFGLVCEQCDDAIMGYHPDSSLSLTVPRIG